MVCRTVHRPPPARSPCRAFLHHGQAAQHQRHHAEMLLRPVGGGAVGVRGFELIKAFLAAFCPHCPHLSSSIPPGICPHCLRHFLAISIRQYPQLATRHSVALPHYFHVTLTQDFPATFIWNVDLPSQGIVRQVDCPNGSISLPSAQPTCPTDMRGWWVGVQMIVTSLMKFPYNILFFCEIYCQIILYL